MELQFTADNNLHRLILKENQSENIVLVDFDYNLTDQTVDYYLIKLTEILSECNEIQKYTMSDVEYNNIVSFTCLLVDFLLKTKNKNVKVLEISGDLGVYSVIIAKVLGIFSQSNKLYRLKDEIYDKNPILNSDQEVNHYIQKVLIKYNVNGTVNLLSGLASEDIDIFHDDFFDIIFVNGNETYSGMISNIVQSTQKLKPNGLLLGTNSEVYYKDLSNSLKIKDFDNNEYMDGDYHTGTIFALKVLFDDQYTKIIPKAKIWNKIITTEIKNELISRAEHLQNREEFNIIIALVNSMKKTLNDLYKVDFSIKDDVLSMNLKGVGKDITLITEFSNTLANSFGFYDIKMEAIKVKQSYISLLCNFEEEQFDLLTQCIIQVLENLDGWLLESQKIYFK